MYVCVLCLCVCVRVCVCIGSRPGTGDTNCTVDSSSTSIREVREASEAAEFTCFTGTKVQILMLKALQVR
jgi:hypothetical protein